MRNEIQELTEHHEKLKRSATPRLNQKADYRIIILIIDYINGFMYNYCCRPDWERCAEYIEGGTDKWCGLAEGKSSDQLVDILLAQIAGVDVSEITKGEAFQGKVCA